MSLVWAVWLNFLIVAVLYGMWMYLWVYFISDVVVPISLWYHVYFFFPQKHHSIQKTFKSEGETGNRFFLYIKFNIYCIYG